jgi:hypothetical protein
MDIKNKNTVYWVIGLGVVAFIIWKLRKVKASPNAQSGNLQKARVAYDKIQQLFGSVPKGGKLPESVLNEVVSLEMEIENQGFTVVDNKLVKATSKT